LVVNSKTSEFCQAGQCGLGSFDQTQSSTYTEINDNFNNTYEANYMQGHWANDTMSWDGNTLNNFTIGVGDGNGTNLPQNLLGVGFYSPQLYQPNLLNPTNETFTGSLAAAGIISSSSFSVTLLNGSENVLFGGLDELAYLGQLQSYPMAPNAQNQLTRLAINVSSISMDGSTFSGPFRAMLDTGEPELRLPYSFVQPIWTKYNITSYNVGYSSYGLTSCSLASSTDNLTVSFPGLNITIPMRSMIMELAPELLTELNVPAGQIDTSKTCLFRLNPQNLTDVDDPYNLGIPFLEAAYTVFDLDHKRIALAPINPAPSAASIVGIQPVGLTNAATPTTTLSSTASTSSPKATTSLSPKASTSKSTTTSASTPSPTKNAGSQLKGCSAAVVILLLVTVIFLQ
jgi:hypothetical protein